MAVAGSPARWSVRRKVEVTEDSGRFPCNIPAGTAYRFVERPQFYGLSDSAHQQCEEDPGGGIPVADGEAHAMKRSSRYAWGPLVVGIYIVLAAVATYLLAPLCVTSPEESGSGHDAVADRLQYWSALLLVSLTLLAGFAGFGLALLVTVGTLADRVGEIVRALKRPRRMDDRGGRRPAA